MNSRNNGQYLHPLNITVIDKSGGWLLVESPDPFTQVWLNPHIIPAVWRMHLPVETGFRHYFGAKIQAAYQERLRPWLETSRMEVRVHIPHALGFTPLAFAETQGWEKLPSVIKSFEQLLAELYRKGVGNKNVSLNNLRITSDGEVSVVNWEEAHFARGLDSNLRRVPDRYLGTFLEEEFPDEESYRAYVRGLLSSDWKIFLDEWLPVLEEQGPVPDATITWY